MRDLSLFGSEGSLKLSDLLLEIDILFTHLGNFSCILDAAIGEAKSKIDFCFFHGGDNFLSLGRIGSGFEIFLVKVNGTNGVAEFIPIEKADLEIGFYYRGVDCECFFKLLAGGRVVEVGHIFTGLAEKWISFVFSIRSRWGVLAGGQSEGS